MFTIVYKTEVNIHGLTVLRRASSEYKLCLPRILFSLIGNILFYDLFIDSNCKTKIHLTILHLYPNRLFCKNRNFFFRRLLVLDFVTNDLNIDGEKILEIYKRRWLIEEYHKSVKQNSSFEKSPTKTVKSQSNYIFYSIVGFCKLELLKIKTATNHFALKAKMALKANIAAKDELVRLKGNECFFLI